MITEGSQVTEIFTGVKTELAGATLGSKSMHRKFHSFLEMCKRGVVASLCVTFSFCKFYTQWRFVSSGRVYSCILHVSWAEF